MKYHVLCETSVGHVAFPCISVMAFDFLCIYLSIYSFLEGSCQAHTVSDLSVPMQRVKPVPWTYGVLRKNCTPVAGVLDDGEELGLELSTAEQNTSTF